MSLLDTFKKDLVDYRYQATNDRTNTKARVLRDLLLTLVGDIERTVKDKGSMSNADMGKRVLAYIDNAKAVELAALTPATYRSDDTAANAGIEIDYLSNFTPKYYTESELETIVGDYIVKFNLTIGDKKALGFLMGQLKREHEGKYDGAMAKTVIQQVTG